MDLINYMEEAVKKSLAELLEEPAYQGFHPSEKDRLDILAFALNHLPARYIVTEKGYVFTKLEELKEQFKTDILVELAKAVQQVRNHPR